MISDRSEAVAPRAILFVHNGQNWITGSERCLIDLMSGLAPEKFRPVLLCNKDAGALADAARAKGIPVHESIGWPRNSDTLLSDRRYLVEVNELVEKYQIRLIHANDVEPIKSLVPVARRHRIPLLAHIHIIEDSATRHASLLHQVSHIVGVSRASIVDVVSDGFPIERTEIIYNGIDAGRLNIGDASNLRAQLGIPDKAICIAAVGSLIHRKGMDIALKSLALTMREDPTTDVHLIVLGDGPLHSVLLTLANDLGVGDRVHFLGRRNDVGAILRGAADIFISASREESLNLSILEASLCGLPIVASDIAAHREALVDGVTGNLLPSEDAVAFAAAISTLVADSERRERYGTAGTKYVRENFNLEQYVAGFDQVYTRLLDRAPVSYGWVGGSRWPISYWGWAKDAVGKRLGR